MKKKFLFIGIMTLLVCIMTVCVSAATYGNLTYSVSNGKVTITDCDTSITGGLVIPSKINGYPVTDIGPDAFYGCKIVSVKIPNSVTSIGNRAFFYSRNLTIIDIPDSVTSIGDFAFRDCTSLTSINIPDSVTSIGNCAFYNCTSLTSINIPDSVTSIGANAFNECTSLASIVVDSENQNYSSDARGALFNKDKTTMIQYPIRNTATAYEIPGSVTSIGNYAFKGCTSLTRVIIGNGVTSIGDYAFRDCTSLTSINIPDSVTSIGVCAFYTCTSLKAVYYSGKQTNWKKISVANHNDSLLNANIHYNSSGPKGFDLSATNISATVRTNPTISVYKPGSTTPYDKVAVTSDRPSIVLPIRNGNVITLACASSGTATITVSATDGSGIKKTCTVNVTERVKSDDDYLLERFALCQLVYSDEERGTNDLISEMTVGDANQKANKSKTMFYLKSDEKVNFKEFYSKYIDDYIVLKTSKNTDNGFFAAAFEEPSTGNVIIAYRGSEGSGALGFLKSWDKSEIDWWGTNLPMSLGIQLSSQFTNALSFYDDIKALHPNKSITVTGHSLGGALASYVAINRNIRCDNINGATGWIFNSNFIAQPYNYPVNYAGVDKYVYEYFNGHADIANNAVTQLSNNGRLFNYSIYNDSQNYNKREKLEDYTRYPLPGEEQYVFTKDYHSISSIINYSDGAFSLAEVKEKYAATQAVKKDYRYFIGTSGNDTYNPRYRPGKVPGRNGYTPVSLVGQFVLGGEGNDTVTIPECGDDTIIGNGGDDTLNGGAGDDIYAYGGNFGHDIIIDPSGNDKIIFTDVSLSDLTISGNKIICGSNSITISSQSKRKADFTVVDKNNKTTKISFAKTASLFSASLCSDEDTATKNIQIVGNATVEIYDAYGELIDAHTINEETVDSVEYKDYGMIALSMQEIVLTLPGDRYIIKVKSDEIINVWAVSDADNPTVAKQTIIVDKDLSDGSVLVISTGELVEEQLSVKLVSGTDEEIIYTPTPESFVITADKTEIRTGETIKLSVPEFYSAAVQWESTNGNVIITNNEDLSVNVTGYTAGEETVRAYLPNDELYSTEFSFEISEDSAPDIVITSNDEPYDGTTTATDSVLFNVEIPEGYDAVVFDTQSAYSQIEDTNTFVVNSVGEHTVSIYCKNSQTGARTKAFTFEFSQDSEAPIIIGVENEAIYYTDRIIEVIDDSFDVVYLNGELCEEPSFAVNEVGNYTITALDTFGNTTDVSFEIGEMPVAENIKQADAEKVSKIRNDFEEVKYLLPEERMDTLESKIFLMEEVLYTVIEVTDFTAETNEEGILVTLRVANAPSNAIVYVASYNNLGTMLEVQEVTLYNGVGEAIFSTNDVYNYKAFVWDSNLMPFVKPTEFYLQ